MLEKIHLGDLEDVLQSFLLQIEERRDKSLHLQVLCERRGERIGHWKRKKDQHAR